jgi:hypothetical protein
MALFEQSPPKMSTCCKFRRSLIICGFSAQDIMHDSGLSNIDRDLDVVDLFCGKAAIHRAVAAQGFTSVPFDKFRIRGITGTGDKNLT